jgi:maltose alpha-D-glucosyltransferase/alpha-amylase
MGDNLHLPERTCARTPMQWSNEPNGGFTTAKKPAMPVIDDGVYGFQHVNVAAQRRDPNSLLNWMERIIRMRKEVPEIGWGDFSFLATHTPTVLAMRYDWKDNAVVCVHNLGPEPREVRFRVAPEAGEPDVLVNLLSADHNDPDENGEHRVLLEPYGYRWYRVGGLGHLLKSGMETVSARYGAGRG